MTTRDILVLTNLTLGQKARHIRLSRGLRQIDLASQAGVSVDEVICLEKDRFLLPTRLNKMLAVLGLLEDGANAATE